MHSIEIILKDFLQEKSVELILQKAQEAQCTLYLSEGYEYFEQEKITLQFFYHSTKNKVIF